jgi:hypothetical protein
MMKCCWCNTYDFSSTPKRRSTLFHLIAQLELISIAEQACRKRLGDSRLCPDAYQAANTRISLLASAIDALLAVYPSRFGGVPF